MKLKTYYGKSLKHAMSQAKSELGDGAILLETQKLKGSQFPFNGNKIIQITAAAENDLMPTTPESGIPSLSLNGDQEQLPEYLQSLYQPELQNPEAEKKIDVEIANIHHALAQLNRRLQNLHSTEFSEPFSTVYERLLKAGLSSDHAALFVRRANLRLHRKPKITVRNILDVVKTEVLVFFNHYGTIKKESNRKKRIISILGATGVGKTTTIMKLAVHPNIYGNKTVGIITTDTYRMAAVESLKAFSKISSIPVLEINNPNMIRAGLEELKEKEIILIDTPGRSPLFTNYIKEQQDYLSQINPTDTLLMLSLTTDLEDLFLTVGLYLTLQPTGIIVTKIDETSRPGKIISMMEGIGLPIHYVTDGQLIPNDIKKGSGEFIWDTILNSC